MTFHQLIASLVVALILSASNLGAQNSLELAEGFVVTSNPGATTGPNIAHLIGANAFHANGYTGDNSITLNVEGGHIWNGHDTLGHVTVRVNNAASPNPAFASPLYDRHATWVGMILGGRNAGPNPGDYQLGIAKDTDLRSGSIGTTWSGNAYSTNFSNTFNTIATPYVYGFGLADVINSSYGFSGATGSTIVGGSDSFAMITDSLANQNPTTTFVAAAGNNGQGNNKIASPGAGYNGITVGALRNNGANVYDAVATFSSGGPQDYRDPTNGVVSNGRVAVDIVAPGDQITSAFYGGQSGGNDPNLPGSTDTPGANLYNSGLGGTSFSTPMVGGSVALMNGAARDLGLATSSHDARVIKANLLNAAAKIPGWSNAQSAHPNGNGGVQTTQALDYVSGAGALDMSRTYTQYLLGQKDILGTSGGTTSETVGWDLASVALGNSTDIVIATPLLAGTEFRATLDWFRERTYTSAASQTDVGFANLDLQIWNSTFTTLYSESLSTYTPVEHLAFNLPVTGYYGIRVKYSSNAFGSLGSEDYGLAWYGVAVPEPGTITIAVLALVGFIFVRRKQNFCLNSKYPSRVCRR